MIAAAAVAAAAARAQARDRLPAATPIVTTVAGRNPNRAKNC